MPAPFPLAKGRLICQAGRPEGLLFDATGIADSEVICVHAHARRANVWPFDATPEKDGTGPIEIPANTFEFFRFTGLFRIDTEGTVDVMLIERPKPTNREEEPVSVEEQAAARARLGPKYEAISKSVDRVFGS